MANRNTLLKSAVFAAVLTIPLSAAVSPAAEDAAANKRTIMTTVTLFGAKKTEVREDNRRVVINEAADGSIKLEIAETINGKETKRTYAATNGQALKQQDAEAYKIYEEYRKTAKSSLLLDLFSDSSKPAKSTRQAITGKGAAIIRLKQARGLISAAAHNLASDRNAGQADNAALKRLEGILAQLKEVEDQLGEDQ